MRRCHATGVGNPEKTRFSTFSVIEFGAPNVLIAQHADVIIWRSDIFRTTGKNAK